MKRARINSNPTDIRNAEAMPDDLMRGGIDRWQVNGQRIPMAVNLSPVKIPSPVNNYKQSQAFVEGLKSAGGHAPDAIQAGLLTFALARAKSGDYAPLTGIAHGTTTVMAMRAKEALEAKKEAAKTATFLQQFGLENDARLAAAKLKAEQDTVNRTTTREEKVEDTKAGYIQDVEKLGVAGEIARRLKGMPSPARPVTLGEQVSVAKLEYEMQKDAKKEKAAAATAYAKAKADYVTLLNSNTSAGKAQRQRVYDLQKQGLRVPYGIEVTPSVLDKLMGWDKKKVAKETKKVVAKQGKTATEKQPVNQPVLKKSEFDDMGR